MRVFVSVDMEGVAGVATLDQTLRGGTGYPRAQALMTAEANAAVRGAFAAGATEVLVNDSHGTMDNLLHDRLDPRARVLFGAPRPSCMVQGLRRGDAMAVFVGYHAGADAPGVLAHTYSSNFTAVRLNGEPVTEALLNGLLAAAHGVPVGVLTGDDEVCAVAAKAFPGIRTVEVKRAEGFAAADSVHPDVACGLIEEATAAALGDRSALSPLPVPARLVLEVDLSTHLGADLAATVPGTERPGARTLRRECPDVESLMSLVMAWYYLAALAAQQTAAIAHRR